MPDCTRKYITKKKKKKLVLENELDGETTNKYIIQKQKKSSIAKISVKTNKQKQWKQMGLRIKSLRCVGGGSAVVTHHTTGLCYLMHLVAFKEWTWHL